ADAPPPPVNGAEAMPAPQPADVVNKPADDAKQSADKSMKEAELAPEQLQKANDPRFSAVLSQKTNVAKVAAAGPAKYKAGEQKALTEAAAQANADSKQGLAAFTVTKRGAGAAVLSRQQAAKAKDEARRREVVQNIQNIFNRTK